MKRILVIGYFVILVAVIAGLTLTCIEEGCPPLWISISVLVTLGLIATSILLYGLSYRPRRFAWFWKIVPFALVAQYAVSWFLGERALFDSEAPLLEHFVIFAGFFTAFYLSFKFGYSKTLPAGKSSPKFIAFIFVVTVLCVASRFLPLNEERINIKVDYVAEYNKITKPSDYDPNENAASYYERAFEVLLDMPNDVKAVRKVWPGDMNDIELNAVKSWLASNSEAMSPLKIATQRPYYWVQRHAESNFFMGIEMPELRKFRISTYFLGFQTKLMVSQGQIKPALQNVIDIYKIGTHLNGPKILVEQLVGIAISRYAVGVGFQIIDKTKPATDLLRDFQKKLEELSAKQNHIIDFTTEKFMICDSIQRMFTDDGKGGGHVFGARLLEDRAYLERLWGSELTTEQRESFKKLERRQTTELTDKMFECFGRAAHKIPWQLYNEGTDLEKVIEEMTKDNPLVNMLTPAAGQVIEISFRRRVDTDALITTIALLRYKAEKGQFPENLSLLIENGYIKELPIDPFSGKPLVYKQIGDDFILYSFAADFDDDGGVPSKWGKGEEGGDQVFWPVEHQEQTKKKNAME